MTVYLVGVLATWLIIVVCPHEKIDRRDFKAIDVMTGVVMGAIWPVVLATFVILFVAEYLKIYSPYGDK